MPVGLLAGLLAGLRLGHFRATLTSPAALLCKGLIVAGFKLPVLVAITNCPDVGDWVPSGDQHGE